jgi:hypothetical protein
MSGHLFRQKGGTMDLPTCEKGKCLEIATACAVLTDSDNIVRAHMKVCDGHAQEMFSVEIDLSRVAGRVVSPTREESLGHRIAEVVHAQQMDDATDEILFLKGPKTYLFGVKEIL